MPATQQTHRRSTAPVRSSGFTLIEMLVAITLVLIMMTMFAQVFQMAGGSISKMRGISENDQRARTLQTIIKADLDKRTQNWVYPFAANEDANAAESLVTRRRGYFYISENNPSDTTDDKLQFTVMSTITTANTDDTPYYGQAMTIPDPTTSSSVQSPFINLPNQPDADDAQLSPNNTGQSVAAEVCYFLRNGNLYRRQLLIRQPSTIITSRNQPDDSASITAGTSLFLPSYPNVPGYVWQLSTNNNGLGTFWGDYDYSAFLTVNGGGNSLGATFLGLDALDNSLNATGSLGNPAFRFGFSPPALGGTLRGRSKEFAADPNLAFSGNPMTYIGSFTLQECSDPNFQYPQNFASSGGVPTHPTDYDLSTDFEQGLGTTGAIAVASNRGGGTDDLRQGLRRGEDLLMTNVHSFDVQVWDTAMGGFINIGTSDPSLTGADYHLNNRNGGSSASYGPRVNENFGAGAINAVFDTWHPKIATDYDGDGQPLGAESPPYRPIYFKPAAITSNPTDIQSWQPQTPYALNALVFPSGPPGTTFPSPPYPAQFFRKMPFGAPFVYRCVVAGTSNGTGSSTDFVNEPVWPKVDGMTVREQSGLTWEAVDNRKPLKALKIIIRFVDPSTQQMRQLTIVHSLAN